MTALRIALIWVGLALAFAPLCGALLLNRRAETRKPEPAREVWEGE